MLTKLKEEAHNRILSCRCIERLIDSEKFEKAFKLATQEEKDQVLNLIRQSDYDALLLWTDQHGESLEYAEMSIRTLRSIAQKIGVPYYSRLGKASLLSEIVRYEKGSTGQARGQYCEVPCGAA